MKTVLIVAALLLVASPASAQVINPQAIAFESPDHASPEVTGYEIDIVNGAGGLAQTLTIAKSATTVTGTTAQGPTVQVVVNVQPVKFGAYTFRVRAIAGAVHSLDSDASETWARSPGQPSKPRVQ